MRRMSKRLSRKSGKSKPTAAELVPKFAWQGEQLSALDGVVAGDLPAGGGSRGSAAVARSDAEMSDRQYVRQKTVISADMLTGQKSERSPRRLHRVLSGEVAAPIASSPAVGGDDGAARSSRGRSTGSGKAELPLQLSPSGGDGDEATTPMVETSDAVFPQPVQQQPIVVEECAVSELSWEAEKDNAQETSSLPADSRESSPAESSMSNFTGSSVSVSATPDIIVASSQDGDAADDMSETISSTSLRSSRSHDAEALLRMVERVSQLERRNQQLALEVDQLNMDKKTVAEMAAVAENAVEKWQSVEVEYKDAVRALKEQLSVYEVRLSAMSKQNEDLSDQLTKSISTSTALKQHLVILGESVSRPASPACPSPAPPSAPASASPATENLLARLDQKTADTRKLEEQCQSLEAEGKTHQEVANAEIKRLSQALRDAQTEQELAERMRQRCQQQNQELQRDKADWLAEKKSRLGSASTASDVSLAAATKQQPIHSKQLETLLLFVSSQLPQVTEAACRTSPEGIDLTRIRQQVLSARQQLASSGDTVLALSEARRQLKDVQAQLKSDQEVQAESESLAEAQLADHEKSLQAAAQAMEKLQSDYTAACAERDRLTRRASESDARRRSSSSELPAEDKQLLLVLRQEKAQLRLELRRAQNNEKMQKKATAELSDEKHRLETLLLQAGSEGIAPGQASCAVCAKNADETHRLRAELDALRDELSAGKVEMSQLEAERNSMRQVNANLSRTSEQHRSELEAVLSRNSGLVEECESVRMQNMTLAADLDALHESHQLAADESLRDEKEALEQKLRSAKEQLRDRATIVRELKQQNEQLHDKLQHEAKQCRELTDSREALMKQLHKKDVELKDAQDEVKEINSVIDQMESLPRENTRLREENKQLQGEIKAFTSNSFDVGDSHHMQREELDQAFRQVEWRLMQLEPKQEQWRKDREELERLRQSDKRHQALLSEASDELTMRRLHNQQIPVLQDQYKSKQREVEFLEQSKHQLQQELREVELEVAVLKEKLRRFQEERQAFVTDQRLQAKLKQDHDANSHQHHIQTLQQRVVNLEEQNSMLASRAMDGAQRQQRLSVDLQRLGDVEKKYKEQEQLNAELQKSLEEARSDAVTNGDKTVSNTLQSQLHGNGVSSRRHLPNGGDSADDNQLAEETVISPDNMWKGQNATAAGDIPPGYDLSADFSGTEGLDDAVLETCRQHSSGNVSGSDEKAVKSYWFKLTDRSSGVDTLCLGRLLYFLTDVSTDLLRTVVNFIDGNGNTALHYLVLRGQLLAAWLLLQTEQCHVDVRNAGGYTCSMMACVAAQAVIKPHLFVLKRLFKVADVDLQAAQDGQTALMMAVGQQNCTVVDLLIQANCGINLQDMDGSTALMFASEHGHEAIVKLLLSREDCNLQIMDRDGNSALQIALEKRRREVVILLYAALVYHKHKA